MQMCTRGLKAKYLHLSYRGRIADLDLFVNLQFRADFLLFINSVILDTKYLVALI